MSQRLVIVDYGMGNLYSVLSALRYLGVEPILSNEPSTVANAEMLLLPGVGSFRSAANRLEKTGLADALREAVLVKKRKILGICLGLQLMAEYSEEDGGAFGLSFIPGAVSRFSSTANNKVPHIGFNEVQFKKESTLFSGLENNVDVYFVHSFKLDICERPGLSSVCNYAGEFLAAYEHQNIFATQFHPEKSQTNGLRILSNFLT